MKNFTFSLQSCFQILLVTLCFSAFGQSIATYDIQFTSVWNSTDHGPLPNNAHWSKLVGAAHNNQVSFLKVGEIASTGIERIAEQGINTNFYDEVTEAINNAASDQYIDGVALNAAEGDIIITGLEVDENFSLLTLVSMIAPSPDWMIAISGLDLRENGTWKTNISIDTFVYDAGSDDGTAYNSPNADSNPKQPISSLKNVSPFNSQKVGTFTITLQNVLSTGDVDQSEKIQIYPNPSKGKVSLAHSNTSDLERIQIFNVLGRLEFETTDFTTELATLNLRHLNSGVYLIRIKSKSGNSTIRKLILQ